MGQRFPLAPMSVPIAVMTLVLLALPLVLAVLGFTWHQPLLTPVALALCALYGLVYLMARPRAFRVDDAGLHVEFPLWRRRLGRVRKTERVDRAELKRRYGVLLRVGVGGLFGGFGWLWSRRGMLEFYVSRTDGMVLLERVQGGTLLITPEQPEALIAALEELP